MGLWLLAKLLVKLLAELLHTMSMDHCPSGTGHLCLGYVVLTQSCVLLSEISEAVSAPNTHSGAKIQAGTQRIAVVMTASSSGLRCESV